MMSMQMTWMEKGWRTLLIDARTGQIIDPEDESSKRYIYSDK